MNKRYSFFMVVLIALLIPAIGYSISYFIINDFNSALMQKYQTDVSDACNIISEAINTGKLNGQENNAALDACLMISNIKLLGQASIIAAIIGAIIPLIYILTSAYAGNNRRKITILFPILLRLSIILIGTLVILQGAIFTYSVYIGESYYFNRVHIFIILSVALGTLVSGLSLMSGAISFGKKQKIIVAGKNLNSTDAPHLFQFIKLLCEKLNAKVPVNIVIGLEPTFYVTSSEIQIPGCENSITGETLFISAPLLRLLSYDEFSSVVGHELGHFRGDDTAYSMKFAPLYAGLGKAIEAVRIGGNDGASSIAKLPAAAILIYMYNIFSTNVATISRDREHKADLAGAEASSAISLSTALVKITAYSNIWSTIHQQEITRITKGKVANNLSIVFRDVVKYDFDIVDIQNIVNQSIEHPTDSHPPLSKRLNDLGITLDDITKDMLLIPPNSAIQIVDNYEDIEQEITLLDHRLIVAYGQAVLPNDIKQNNLLHAIYSLAASLIRADEKIDPYELIVAESIGHKLFDDFDSIEFREYCNARLKISDVIDLSNVLGNALNAEGKDAIINYLRVIATSNGVITESKLLIINKISTGLKITSTNVRP